ncbi:hypothetical protein KKA47_01795, partial [bacterium]|nr:hypothetical protein [bacterium]
NHPWFVGCQFHPEYKSRPMKPHPIFASYIKAATAYAKVKNWEKQKNKVANTEENVKKGVDFKKTQSK